MAKLLHLKRLGKGFVAWWVGHRQKRRRAAAVPVVPAPVITSLDSVPDETQDHWVDIHLAFTFNGTGLPVATFQIWMSSNDGPFVLVDTIPSTALTYHHVRAFEDGPSHYVYKMRYRDGSVEGPYSLGFPLNW